MIINDLDGYYIVFDTKNWNTELDTLPFMIQMLLKMLLKVVFKMVSKVVFKMVLKVVFKVSLTPFPPSLPLPLRPYGQ